MRQFSIFDFQFSSLQGFTLIELIVVFSLLAIISTVGIASFERYADAQRLRASTLAIKTLLQQARSQASAQVKPDNCGTFQGYEVRICCVPNGSSCPTCLSTDNYELDAVCSSVPSGILVSSSKLSTGVSVDTVSTTQRSFLFIPITGGVVKGGNIILDGANNAKQTITITSLGIIQ